MPTKNTIQSDGLKYLYDKFVGDDLELIASFEENLMNAEIAHVIYRLRTKAGLSQRELAKKVGTTTSVISRLEDADHEGHTLAMLKRIAAALDQRLRIKFIPLRENTAIANKLQSRRRQAS